MPPKKKPGVACMRCTREYPLEDTRFDTAEDAEGQDFMCRMCVMESRLDRLEQEKEELKVQVDGLVEELKIERQQREVLEGKLAQVESACVPRDAIPESNGVRHGASAPSVPSSEAGRDGEARAAAHEAAGGHDSAGHGEGPNAVVEEGEGSPPGQSYAEAMSAKAPATKTPAQLKEPRERRVTIVGDSNMRRAEQVITKRVGEDQRVKASTLPGKTVSVVMERAKEQVWDTMTDKHLVVIMGGLNDVLQGSERGIAKQVAKGVTELRAISDDVQIAVCTVPEVEGRGGHVERAVVEANREIWTLSKAMNFEVVELNREVHRAGRGRAFVRDGVHFTEGVAEPVGRRLAARAVAFLGGPRASRKLD